MSETPHTIETRPTLTIDVRDPEAPPHPQVASFDATAQMHPGIVLAMLDAWPPKNPPTTEAEARVEGEISRLLEASEGGRRLQYDNMTQGAFNLDPQWITLNDVLQAFRHPEADLRADIFQEKVSVRGLALYVARTAEYNMRHWLIQDVA